TFRDFSLGIKWLQIGGNTTCAPNTTRKAASTAPNLAHTYSPTDSDEERSKSGIFSSSSRISGMPAATARKNPYQRKTTMIIISPTANSEVTQALVPPTRLY